MNTQTPCALRMYGWVFETLTPFFRWWLRQRLKRGKESQLSLDQRWMRRPPPRPHGTLVWGHAVGVGEALALVGLLKRLHKLRPELHFLITTTARTSGEALDKQGLGPTFTHWFSPVDTPSNVARFLAHWQPDLALWCEMDLWPALISATAERGVPHVLVNARLNAQSLAKRRWGRALYAPLLAGFSSIWAQNAETSKYLQTLGAPAARIDINGTIKATAPPLAVNTAELVRWREALGKKLVWVLASSHFGEDELALAAHSLLRLRHPEALLIIVPRDSKRGPTIAALCGNSAPQRSQGATLPTESPYYIADTMGELGLWYRLGRVAMIGGSWVNVGGHNPFEATCLGCTVLHGPYIDNFSESYAKLDSENVSSMVRSPEEIADIVTKLWTDSVAIKQTEIDLHSRNTAAIHRLLDLLPPNA